jgi:hypothetical protein
LAHSPPPDTWSSSTGTSGRWCGTPRSGVTFCSKIDFVVDFRNLLFGRDFDLSFSKGYSLMKIFNHEVDFTAKYDT